MCVQILIQFYLQSQNPFQLLSISKIQQLHTVNQLSLKVVIVLVSFI